MKEKWEDHKWIFEPDGSLLDIYVQQINLATWMKLIEFLNKNYQLKFGFLHENDVDTKIDKTYVKKMFLDDTGDIERKAASILLNDIKINCYFFLHDEIEFDIDPKEIRNQVHFEEIIEFMTSISKELEEQVILTAEGSEYSLIKTNVKEGLLKISTKAELRQMHDKGSTLFSKMRGTYIRSLLGLMSLMKNSKLKDLLFNHIIDLMGVNKIHAARKKK